MIFQANCTWPKKLNGIFGGFLRTVMCLSICGWLTVINAKASGTWTALASGPPVGVNNCLLLSDGTVLGMNGAGQCVKLTPDIHGSYINGTWTSLPTMNDSRLFFASDVLTNGNVFVAGGEYGDAGHYAAELYDSLANTWTIVPGSQAPNFGYSDSPSEMLPNGNLLVSDSQSTYNFYNTASNLMIHGGGCGDMNEVCWVKLANSNIFCVDNYGGGAEHFVPSANEWIVDATSTPSGAQGGDDENYLLPNGQVFHAGSVANSAFYTPGATPTSAGTLVNGPNFPIVGTNQLVAGESPGAILVNGNILMDLAPNGGGASGGGPCYFYEFNYLSNSFTQVSAPGGGTSFNSTPFANSMLLLPDGSVLFVGGQNSGSLYIYTPNAVPLAQGQPVISSITENLDGSYHLAGTMLNGISEGAEYGDDEQMACNYPIVRLTNNSSTNVYYARTYGWSSTTVQNTNPVTTEFSLPPNLPTGTYSLVVTAVGNPSAARSFTYSPPAAPTGLTGTIGNAQAVISWNPVSGATSYNLKRLTTIGTPYYAKVATVTGTSCTNTGLINDLSYFFEVSAVGANGESTNSLSIFLTPSGPPAAPVGVTAVPDTFARIGLAWTASFGATNYEIQRSTIHGGPYTNLATSVNPFYTDAGLVNGITYYYVISAMSAAGTSANSAEVSATAQAVGDFGFETPSIGSGNYQYVPTGSFWTFGGTNGNSSGILANGSGFSNPNAPEGVQAAFVQSNGVISQLLTGFVPGSTYSIIYSAAQRPGNSQTWNVMIDNNVIQTNAPGGTSYVDYTATFVATAINHTLAFVGTDLNGGDNTVFLDNVRVGIVSPSAADAGFETPSIGDFQYDPTGAPWTFSGAAPSGSGIVANGSGFGNPNAPQGVQAAFIQELGTISQTISGFTPGTPYGIIYSAAQRSGGSQHGGESWNVKIDNTVIASNAPGGTSYSDCVATFVATASSHKLSFVGTDLAGNDNTVFLDNVIIISLLQPAAPAITLTTPTNGTFVSAPSTITLAANVVSNGNSISNVQFYANSSNLLGQASSPPYNYSWTGLVNGNYTVFARLTYNNGSVMDSAAAVVTIVNGNENLGFELPVLGSGNYQYDPSGGSWVFEGGSGNGSGLVANGSAFGNPNSPQGVQAAFLQGYSSITQTLTGFTPGVTYDITFSAAQRGGTAQHGGQSWNVTIDGVVIASYAPVGTSFATYTAAFTASASIHTLSFVGTDLATGDNTVFIDSVIITPLPPSVPTGLTAISTNNEVILSWLASAGAVSYNVKSSTNNGVTYTVLANVTGTGYTNTGLTGGISYYYVVSAVNPGGQSANSLPASTTPEPLPSPWLTTDIGSVGVAGVASYSNGVFTLSGSGNDISNSADAFRYVYQPVTNSFTVTARVTSQSDTDPWAKAGVMVRETTNANSKYFAAYVTPTSSHGVSVQSRATTGGSTADLTDLSGPAVPYWLRIVRNNNTFTAYSSPDGTSWAKTGSSQNITMAGAISLGLPVCSRNNSLLGTATFDKVTAAPLTANDAPPALTAMLANGQFTLQFLGAYDLNYVVETSTNLVNWTPVYTNALADGGTNVFIFMDTNTFLPADFYRISQ